MLLVSTLSSLAHVIESEMICAHVRAASDAGSISEMNCHPFAYGRLLFMHNGCIAEFKTVRDEHVWINILCLVSFGLVCMCFSLAHVDSCLQLKRALLRHVGDLQYQNIRGTTDTEVAFAIFLTHLSELLRLSHPETWNAVDYANLEMSADQLIGALKLTVQTILEVATESQIEHASSLNFVVVDGQTMVATRFRNHVMEGDERCVACWTYTMHTRSAVHMTGCCCSRVTCHIYKILPRSTSRSVPSSLNTTMVRITCVWMRMILYPSVWKDWYRRR